MPKTSIKILVTGGCGFIGCHTLVSLSKAGYTPIVLDNLSNSSLIALERVQEISKKNIKFYNGDVRNSEYLDKIFSQNDISGVIHLAGLKAVGESCRDPISYYDNNVKGTLVLLNVMKKYGITNFVFSSSATVYSDNAISPIKEDSELLPTNPYGQSKLMIERICRDLEKSSTNTLDNSWRIALLRYFNPIGAHETGLIGEDPMGEPNNLMPYISQVAIGKLKRLTIFGDDYPTIDGTGVRDYIHVMDLAEGHVAALQWILNINKESSECKAFNLGTGIGTSVLQLVSFFEKETGVKIPFVISSRRQGDVPECFADPSLAKSILNWKAVRTFERMVSDVWRWQSDNPMGYVRSQK